MPVISRSRHLRVAAMDEGVWRTLTDRDERIWLFNPPDSLLDDPMVQRRLTLDVAEGGCNRSAFKVATRKPWYRTPMPEAPSAFMSGMQSGGPWLTLNGMPTLSATNTLYVVHFASSVTEDEQFAIGLAFLTTKVRKQLLRRARRYADGLWKHEPGCLRSIVMPDIGECRESKAKFLSAMHAHLHGDFVAAQRLADNAFS